MGQPIVFFSLLLHLYPFLYLLFLPLPSFFPFFPLFFPSFPLFPHFSFLLYFIPSSPPSLFSPTFFSALFDSFFPSFLPLLLLHYLFTLRFLSFLLPLVPLYFLSLLIFLLCFVSLCLHLISCFLFSAKRRKQKFPWLNDKNKTRPKATK